MKRVYILAHCDDELFCLPLLLDKSANNTIIYLTTRGKSVNAISKLDARKFEAQKTNGYLSQFINLKTIFFDKNVFDGSIHTDFNFELFQELAHIVLNEEPDEVVTLCYEAGHQDHDSVELITRILSKKYKIKMRSFSGYKSYGKSSKLFLVSKPNVNLDKISFNRVFTLWVLIRLILIYRSQFKTWLGLGPFLILKYVFFTFWESKVNSSMCLDEISNYFYENRGRASRNEVLFAHQKFISNFLIKNS